MVTQSNQNIPVAIDKRSKLSKKEFINEYVKPGIPVVVTDAAKDWKAMGKFTPQFFKETYGDKIKKVKGVDYKIGDYIDLMLKSTTENPSPYPFNLNVEKYFPELMSDIMPHLLYGKIDRISHPLLPKFMLKGTEPYELFFGGNGSFFPTLHIDALFLHTQITQVYGSKEFILYGKEQTQYMYPRSDNNKLSEVNIFNPDYEKHPLFKKAKALTVTVNEGETIFFPTGFWHATQIHEPCISLGRIQLNSTNWNDFVSDNNILWKKYNPKIAPIMNIYAKTLGGVMNLQERFI